MCLAGEAVKREREHFSSENQTADYLKKPSVCKNPYKDVGKVGAWVERLNGAHPEWIPHKGWQLQDLG